MRRRVTTAIGLLALLGTAASADIAIDVVPSSAPNAYGSASWAGYITNTLTGLENGLTQVGDRQTDPAGYSAITNGIYEPGDTMVTSFKSWRGFADPGTQWGSQFANELGNRMHFGLHAMGDGAVRFALADVTFDITSSDGVLNYAGDFVGLDYSSNRFGVDWGPDRQRGGGDDVVYNSGNGTTLVDEIVYVGVGNAYWPQASGGQTDQEAIDEVVAWIIDHNVSMVGSYSIAGTDGGTYDGSVGLALPTPGGLVLLGLAGLGLTRRRGR